MSTRTQLLDEVIAKIISGNRSTTAANLRILLNDLIDSSYIPASDGVIPIYNGFLYWKGNPLAPIEGDIREGYESTTYNIELQEYKSGAWTTGDNARMSR